MKHHHPIMLIGAICALAATAPAQTKLELSAITPGTEKVRLVDNGDFQNQGAAVSNAHPEPAGWTRHGDIFAARGTNLASANGGVVALADITRRVEVSGYDRKLTLAPKTEYVLSCYMWNFGDAENNVIAVIDLNDAPDEPQITLTTDADENMDKGYFVYSSFNTTDTGTNITVRLFYESPIGKGTAAKYFPVAAQWDNLAITKASEFEPPRPAGAKIASPVADTSPAASNSPAGASGAATATK